MPTTIEITLISKPGCHLCDDARVALAAVVVAFTDGHPDVSVHIAERNILEDPALALKHSEEIPVVLIDGKMHSYWHVNAAKLMAALDEKANA